MKIIQSPSPNYSPSTHKIIGAQLHKTLGLMPWTLQWMRNPRAQAAPHVLFTRNGAIHQLVQLDKRPWTSGRFNRPSARAKKILKRHPWGTYIKPGHYLLQCEFECLLQQTFTRRQYDAVIWYFRNKLDVIIDDSNLLEHQDTAIDKPDMEAERSEILRLLRGLRTDEDIADAEEEAISYLVLDNGESAEIKVEDGKVMITKK